MDIDLGGDLDFATPRFVMTPLDWTDAADVFIHFTDPEVVEYLDIEALDDVDEAEGIIGWARTIRAEGQGVRWAIRGAGGGFVGTCGFNAIHLQRGRRGEVAYDLARAWWGQGVMDEIMPRLIDFGHGRLGLRRLEAMVTPGNVRSCRLLERHGFKAEGLLRDYGYWRGRYWDQLIYGRLSDDA